MGSSTVPGPTRRGFLRTLAGAGLITAGVGVLRALVVTPAVLPRWRTTWEALLDTLLPEGDFPGWRTTGIDAELRRRVTDGRAAARAVVKGLGWLDDEAGRRHGSQFAALAPAHRTEIVAAAAAAPAGSVPHYLYRVVRDRAMRLHYAARPAWRAAGLPHPPQPDGYPGFAGPPDA